MILNMAQLKYKYYSTKICMCIYHFPNGIVHNTTSTRYVSFNQKNRTGKIAGFIKLEYLDVFMSLKIHFKMSFCSFVYE